MAQLDLAAWTGWLCTYLLHSSVLIGSTWVVIITVLIISFYLGIIDLGLSKLVKSLLR